MASKLPEFQISTQQDPYWEIPLYDTDGHPLSIDGRTFEAWVSVANVAQGTGNTAPPIKVLKFGDGLTLVTPTDKPDSTVKNTLVHRIDRVFAQNNLPRGELTADILEVVDGARRLFIPVRLRYQDPAAIRDFVPDAVGVTFGGSRQPVITPLAIAGREGARGSGYLTGEGAPTEADGQDGDYWIDASADPRLIYGPKAGGAWPAQGEPFATDLTPELRTARDETITAAAAAADHASVTQADRQAVETSTVLVESARSEVATNRQAVEADRNVVQAAAGTTATQAGLSVSARQAAEAARDVVLPARDVVVAARDQAVTAAATAAARAGQFATLAALRAIPNPSVITAAEVTADGTNNGGYQYDPANAAAGWVLKSSETVPGLSSRMRNRALKTSIDGGTSDVDPERRVLSKITREGHLLQGRNLLRPVLGRHADLRTDEAGRILEATGRDGSLIQGLTEYRASITGTVGIFTENGSPIAVRDALGVDPEAAAYHATVIEGQVLAWVGGAPVKITGGTDYTYADASISGGQITIVRSDLKLWTSPLRGRWPVLAPGTDTIIVSDTVGQSNGSGSSAGGVIHANSFNPRFLMFAAGQRTYGNWLGHSQERQQPLYISPDATLDIDYGREHVFGDAGETSSSGFAHGVLSASALPARASLLTTVSAVGSASPEMILRNATELTSLVNVMGAPFAMEEAKFIRAVLMGRLSGKRVYAGPVRVNIGESIIGRSKADAYASYAAIAADWANLARQWDALWPAAGMGGFEAKAPALIAQTCSGAIYGFAKSQVPWAQLQIGLDDPTTALCIGPTYDQAYAADGVHLLAAGQEMWGARAAAAWNAWLRGERYMPLHVRKDAGFAPVRTGTTVRLRIYNHFNLPLVFDTATITGLGADQGFRWSDDGNGNTVTVTGATIVNNTTVDLALSAAPTGTNGAIEIAMTGASGALSGPATGNRATLRTNGSGIFTDGNFAAPRAVEHFICIDRVPVV